MTEPVPVRMHEHEVSTDPGLVRRLLGAQFPQWAGLPVSPVRTSGTDNAVYRLGEELSVRMPRIGWGVEQVAKEHVWLPRLAPHLPLAVPEPLAQGEPAEGYPYPWAVHRWLEGENLTWEALPDPLETARSLARFVLALRRIPSPPDAPRANRGEPLHTRDTGVREAVAALHGQLDGKAVLAAWDASLHADEWLHAPVWAHGDLLPGNLLFRDGVLSAVIDFGGLGVGDPACDLLPAWSLFAGESREVYRSELAADEALWLRGRGHALAQALAFIPYYRETNPAGVRTSWRVVGEVLADARTTS